MFNRDTVKHLQTLNARPSVTITLPTNRTAPDNQKDPIRLKNLVTEATERLEAEFGKRETAELTARLQELADGVDHDHNQNGLVLFVSADYRNAFKVPYRLPERVAIDDNFLTRDIVFAMNRSPLYWVLVLTEKPTRLYLGQREELSEVREYGFPQEYSGPGAGSAVSSGIGANPSQEKDRALEAFMRDVDASLLAAVQEGPFPVLLVGLPQNLSAFGKVTRHADFIMRELPGGHDSLNAHELGELVWPEARAALRERRREIFDQLETARGQGRTVSDLDEAWQASIDGRVDVMVVEESMSYPAQVSADGRSITPLPTGKEEGADAYADAVDEMMEAVMQHGGRAVFVEDGELQEYGGLVMLTRY